MSTLTKSHLSYALSNEFASCIAMNGVHDDVLPLQPSGVRPSQPRGGGNRISIRGVAVAPHLGATQSGPKRGSSVLHNIRDRALPSISIDTTPPRDHGKTAAEDDPAAQSRPEPRKAPRRSNSSSQVIRGLSSEPLRTLDSIDILPQDSNRSVNEHSTSQGSPLTRSKVLPRRKSYVLHKAESVKPRRCDPQGKLLHQHNSLKNIRELPAFVPKLPGTIEGSPEKKTLVENGIAADNTDTKRATLILAPPPRAERQPSNLVAAITVFGYSLAPLYDFWERFQVSHCGQYSVERMLALDEYCRRVSIVRALAVCLLFPFGPLLVVVLAECLPLQPVEKGVMANYVFWIRHTIMGSILVLCSTVQAKVWIPEISLSMKHATIVAIASATIYTASTILVADLWAFPIPFLVVTGAPLMVIIWAMMSRIVLGAEPLAGLQDGQFRGRRFIILTTVQALLLGIYPAYQAVFLEVDGIYELAMIALLPAINLALKNLQTALGSHLEDNLPEVITFSVDAFNAIYSVLCMHSANSLKMVAVTLMLNALVMILSLHGMNRRSRVARACRSFQMMERQQQKLRRTQSVLDSVVTGGCSPELLSTLVATTLRMLQAPGQLDPHELQTIRLLSGMPHKLSSSSTALLDSLAARCVYNNTRLTSIDITVAQIKSRFSSAAMEGRKLSAAHFPVPSPLAKRLRGAVIVVPTSRWLSFRANSRSNSRETDTSSWQTQNQENDSKSTESEDSETPMLDPPPSSAPRLSHLIHATSSSIVEPIKTPPRIPSLWQAASDKLIPLVSRNSPVINNVLEETRKQNTRAVKQTLQLLFNNEYLGLIAYVQCIIPAVYLLYMPVLQALPNHVYYPTYYRYFGASSEFDRRMTVIGMLALLQLLAFLALQAFVVKRFGVSTIYQVAFVLETHFMLLQGRLLMWLIFAVQSTLVHYGKWKSSGKDEVASSD